ncbi:MAG: hypothetical protein KME09_21370 [Pleurocapsa minor HA4230-MV1]|jgi:hypothetical protein|nr:hypothetical protein [Pleurocapsa minor HA4230-MV1]
MTIKILNYDLALDASTIGEILPPQQASDKCVELAVLVNRHTDELAIATPIEFIAVMGHVSAAVASISTNTSG